MKKHDALRALSRAIAALDSLTYDEIEAIYGQDVAGDDTDETQVA